jgi:hypothetical protein
MSVPSHQNAICSAGRTRFGRANCVFAFWEGIFSEACTFFGFASNHRYTGSDRRMEPNENHKKRLFYSFGEFTGSARVAQMGFFVLQPLCDFATILQNCCYNVPDESLKQRWRCYHRSVPPPMAL